MGPFSFQPLQEAYTYYLAASLVLCSLWLKKTLLPIYRVHSSVVGHLGWFHSLANVSVLVLPGPPPLPCDLPPKKKKEGREEQQQQQSLICVAHILTGALSNSWWPAP